MVFCHAKTTIGNVNREQSVNKTWAKKILLDINELRVLLFPTTCLYESKSQRETVKRAQTNQLYMCLCLCGSTSTSHRYISPGRDPPSCYREALKVTINLPAPGLETLLKDDLADSSSSWWQFVFFFFLRYPDVFKKVTDLINTIATGL